MCFVTSFRGTQVGDDDVSDGDDHVGDSDVDDSVLVLRGGICPCRQCRRQCKIFASGVNFSIFTHFLCFFLLKLLKLGEIDGVKFLA